MEKNEEEKKEAEAQKKKGIDENINDRQPEEDIIKTAREVAAELREGLTKREELLEREEKLLKRQEVLRELGGRSLAGQQPQKKEETPKEYKDRIMRGEI